MKHLLITVILLPLLASCCPPPQSMHTMRYIQPMPDNSGGVRAGCIRTLARLAIYNGTEAQFDIDWAARFCDDVERSFHDELRLKDVQSI